uniref:MmgE/PrpD family protein n=1 Tax=candidate division WOR-3 bacterium TaxID=2052148 RepID=A0A7C2PLQ5_UNCW3
MKDLTTQIAKNIVELEFHDIPKDAIEWAKIRILDVIGCIIAGRRASGSLSVKRFVEEMGGTKESTILGNFGKVPSHYAALVHAIWARSFDFEPIHPYVDGESFPAHISGTTIPVALAMGEAANVTPKEMLCALVIGDDITSRLVAASRFNLELGWDNTGTINAFGACAIAGKLLGLNETELKNAFGLVVNQLGGILQNVYEAVDSFKLPQGLAAQAGIISAKLAQKGFKGAKEPLEGAWGFFKLYCRDPNPSIVLRHLGKRFYSDSVIKPYPCCRANHAAVDCAIEIVKKAGPLQLDEIEYVNVYVPPSVARIFVNRPYGSGEVKQIDAAFNLRYCVAKSLLKGELKIYHFWDNELEDEEVLKLCKLINIIPNEIQNEAISCKLEVILKSGYNLYAQITVPKGDRWHNPLSNEEIIAKFLENLEFGGIGVKRSEKLIEVVSHVEDFSTVSLWMDEINLLMKNGR